VIGRNDELRRLIDVLTRRTKSSGVLLGEPGTGKTAIVEGLAARCADGDVPEGLRGCRILALELGMLMAGEALGGKEGVWVWVWVWVWDLGRRGLGGGRASCIL
jgi:ATP-dependent Clp protease ATP-binding subunit ClpB